VATKFGEVFSDYQLRHASVLNRHFKNHLDHRHHHQGSIQTHDKAEKISSNFIGLQVEVFWIVTPCSSAVRYHPEDGGSTDVRNVGILPHNGVTTQNNFNVRREN